MVSRQRFSIGLSSDLTTYNPKEKKVSTLKPQTRQFSELLNDATSENVGHFPIVVVIPTRQDGLVSDNRSRTRPPRARSPVRTGRPVVGLPTGAWIENALFSCSCDVFASQP